MCVCQAANCPSVLTSSPERGVADSNDLNHLAEGGRESEDSLALMVWVCKALANSASNGETRRAALRSFVAISCFVSHVNV